MALNRVLLPFLGYGGGGLILDGGYLSWQNGVLNSFSKQLGSNLEGGINTIKI